MGIHSALGYPWLFVMVILLISLIHTEISLHTSLILLLAENRAKKKIKLRLNNYYKKTKVGI